MNKKELIYQKIEENQGIITTKSAVEHGIYKDLLKEMLEKNELVKIAKGLYTLPEEIDEYLYFSYRIPKGIFSHETAAYLHGLSTRMPLIYRMTVQVGDNVTRVKSLKKNLFIKYCKKEDYNLGKTTITNPFGREISVYDKERTILDLIKNKDKIDLQVFSEAMQTYFNSKDKNLLKLSQYAVQLKMEKALRQYTEILL